MHDLVLTEEDIRLLFHAPERQYPREKTLEVTSRVEPVAPPPPAVIESPATTRYHSKSRRAGRALLTFFVALVGSFFLLNAGTFGSRLSFWWRNDIRAQESRSPVAVNLPTTPGTPVSATLPGNRLFVPKIGVEAPIIWNSDPVNVLADLANGVAHYRGTAIPGERTGNVFITGHSSNYIWDKGHYNRVFANLDKLVVGDLISLTTSKNEYLYRVTGSVVVKPSQLEVLNPTPTPTLSLMTCVPVGTNLRRLVVQAELVKVIGIEQTVEGAPLQNL